jgi:hypothetical protein
MIRLDMMIPQAAMQLCIAAEDAPGGPAALACPDPWRRATAIRQRDGLPIGVGWESEQRAQMTWGMVVGASRVPPWAQLEQALRDLADGGVETAALLVAGMTAGGEA